MDDDVVRPREVPELSGQVTDEVEADVGSDAAAPMMTAAASTFGACPLPANTHRER